MQGRFSKKIGANYQHFPIDNWHNEFKQAKRFNFDAVEWIITDFSNPIFNEEFVNIIKKKMSFNKIKMNSISLDVIMNKSLFTIDNKDLLWLLDKLEIVIKIFKVKRISVPIEEESKYNNFLQKNKALKTITEGLLQLVPILNKQPYLLYDEYSMLDVAMAPLLWRLDHYGIKLPASAKPLMKYADSLFNRPLFDEAMTPAEKAMR